MTTPGVSRSRFLAGAAGALGAAALPAVLTPAPAGAAAGRGAGSGVRHRGVVYGVVGGAFPETSWHPARMRADVRSIAHDLHANAIVIEGDGPDRLLATASEAAARGLSVWLRPTLGDVPAPQILDHLAEVARGAERLRRDGARMFLSVGCEFVLYVPGIVPGADALERIKTLLSGNFDPVAMQRRLDSFIGRAAGVGRSTFRGPMTYSAAADDVVDWTLFDIVGIDYYAWFRTAAAYRRDLSRYQRFGKPLAIMEFGTCTYRDAPRLGADGLGWNVVDYAADPPHVVGDLVRSEATQARYLTDLLGVFDSMGLFAAMVFNYGDADAPHRSARRYDLDLASYGLVAPIWDSFDRPGRRWRWERKKSFRAVAGAYACRGPAGR